MSQPVPPIKLLVIDDEEAICYAFGRYFAHRGMHVESANRISEALTKLANYAPEVIFLDINLPDGNGLDALPHLQELAPQAAIVVITAYGSMDMVAKAMQGRASDFLVKPLDLDQAESVVREIIAESQERQHLDKSAVPAELSSDTGMVGRSTAMQQVYKRIGLVAQTDASVLIEGETGTGKELVARAIHLHSSRADGPFVAVNCAALPDNLIESELFGYVRGAFTGADNAKAGRFESADGGTLFLDELGELPLSAQVKLLRFLDSHVIERLGSVQPIRVNVRIVAATNRDLQQAISAGAFRADLFYRLAVVQINLPPLRERGDDVVLLARYFLATAGAAHCQPPAAAPAPAPELSRDAVNALRRYCWPGNVRELRNVMAHAAICAAGNPVLYSHLPASVVAKGGGGAAGSESPQQLLLRQFLDSLAEQPGQQYEHVIGVVEAALFAQALERSAGNCSAAADWLGIHRNTLSTKLRERKS